MSGSLQLEVAAASCRRHRSLSMSSPCPLLAKPQRMVVSRNSSVSSFYEETSLAFEPEGLNGLAPEGCERKSHAKSRSQSADFQVGLFALSVAFERGNSHNAIIQKDCQFDAPSAEIRFVADPDFLLELQVPFDRTSFSPAPSPSPTFDPKFLCERRHSYTCPEPDAEAAGMPVPAKRTRTVTLCEIHHSEKLAIITERPPPRPLVRRAAVDLTLV